MTEAVADAVALAHHLEDSLPGAAERTFREAENGRGRIYIPEIALGELLYTALRGRLKVPNPEWVASELIDQIRGSGYLVLSTLGPTGWGVFLRLRVPELHDRMIASDAIARNLPLITNDPELSAVPGLQTIWKR